MSFLFPNTIEIHRPRSETDVGAVGYMGVEEISEMLVVGGLAASIQARSGSSRPSGGDLPSSPPAPITWKIYIQTNSLIPPGSIHEQDIVVDEIGRRFQIDAAYYHPMGWSLMTILLEER